MDRADIRMLARAVATAVFDSLVLSMNATNKADQERWAKHADKLESKFTHDFGMHYARAMELTP